MPIVLIGIEFMKNRRLLMAGTLLIAVFAFLTFQNHFGKKSNKITLIVPVEHRALADMANGFGQEIRDNLPKNTYDLNIVNAMGDRHVMRTLVEQAGRRGDKVVATIGTEMTLMASHALRDVPVVGLDVTSEVTPENGRVTGVYEGETKPCFTFILEAIPTLRKVTLLYTPSDKIEKQLSNLEHTAMEHGIALQKIVVQSLADLNTLAHHIDGDSGAIFILKDIVLASGAATLKKIAEQKNIPFIASDEGSVINGAAFAVGNSEYDIGRAGAALAVQIVQDKSPKDLPMKPAAAYQVFINPISCQKQGIDYAQVERTAKARGYPLQIKNEQ